MTTLKLFFENRIVETHKLLPGGMLIGRDQGCDIRLDSLAVATRHARVLPQQDGRFVIAVCAPGNELLINHQQVRDRQQLQHGDVIRIGRYSLCYSEPAAEVTFLNSIPETSSADTTDQPVRPPVSDAAAETPFASLAVGCIQVTNGKHVGKTIPLDRPLMRLGLHSSECAMIARRHDGYYISHLEGSQPPLLNGLSIGESSICLHDGSRIRLGAIEMLFYADIAQTKRVASS